MLSKKVASSGWIVTLLVISMTLAACSGAPATPAAASPTPMTMPTETMLKIATLAFTATAVTPTLTGTPEPPTQTPTPAHSTHPDDYNGAGSYTVWDSQSTVTAKLHRPQGGEYYNKDMYERPFNADSQDTYYPQVDIVKTTMMNGTPWVYGSITLQGTNPNTQKLDATYGIELDVNKDGRGDTLILVNSPASTSWSTAGVQVWADSNQDVGNKVPIRSDPPQTGNGYEQLVFDQGSGSDPDLAWASLASGKPNEVWFAFKSSLIQDAKRFLWSAWAQQGGLHPDWFDYNDHFTLDQAGSPLPGTQYPMKALAAVDDTCRWAIGFAPSGDEPGLCPLPPTATSTPSETPVPTKTPKRTSTPKHTSTPKPTAVPTS
jgi:hypothetical protein